MRDQEREYRVYLEDALRNLELAREFAGSGGFPAFERDQRVQYAAIRALEVVNLGLVYKTCMETAPLVATALRGILGLEDHR